MKISAAVILALAAVSFSTGSAADVKTYQVTGPVLEVTDTSITVQKDDQKWEIAREKKTKGAAKVKVGDKVTIYYHMVAEEVEAKGDKSKAEKK